MFGDYAKVYGGAAACRRLEVMIALEVQRTGQPRPAHVFALCVDVCGAGVAGLIQPSQLYMELKPLGDAGDAPFAGVRFAFDRQPFRPALSRTTRSRCCVSRKLHVGTCAFDLQTTPSTWVPFRCVAANRLRTSCVGREIAALVCGVKRLRVCAPVTAGRSAFRIKHQLR